MSAVKGNKVAMSSAVRPSAIYLPFRLSALRCPRQGLRKRRKFCVKADLTANLRPISDVTIIPGGKGKATSVKEGDIIKVINIHGTQVVDFWAFSEDKWGKDIMSMHHTRNALCRTTPRAGDMLYTASMVPIMQFLEDSGPGVHDTTAAACRSSLEICSYYPKSKRRHSCLNTDFRLIKK